MIVQAQSRPMPVGPAPRFLLLASLIALVFMVKFATYAWLVTPLWDIPDEPGHYGYAEDLSRGEWPVLGKAHFSEEVMHSWRGEDTRPGRNWIAQHPPLFYAVDAPVIAAARVAGLDFDGRVRAARLPSALFGALTILGLALLLMRATGNQAASLAGAILFGATPMFTHLSTGVTHDTLVACTAAWAVYWCTRWLQSGGYRHLLYSAVLAGLCTVTKVTALAMAVPFFFAIAWQLWRSDRSARPVLGWVLRAGSIWIVMFGPILLWMARNLMIFGQLFPDASLLSSHEKVPIGYFDLMLDFPFWEHTLLNFIALVGWNGSGDGTLAWIQANGWMARYYLAALGVAGLMAIALPVRDRIPERIVHMGFALLLLVAAWIYIGQPTHRLALWTSAILLLAMIATMAGQARGFFAGRPTGWLLFTAAMCVATFAWIYYHHLWGSFIGTMRATHGRYFYPVAPFLLLVLVWPFRRQVYARFLLPVAIGAMVATDLFYVRQVLPLYGHVSS